MLRRIDYTGQEVRVMRALSIRSFLIQACIGLVAIWPDRIGAEDKRSAAFRIEISQPQYGSRVGEAWTCPPSALVQLKCRQSVPLIIFGRPTAAEIQVRVTVSPSKRYAVEVYASLDHPRGWYRAVGGRLDRIFLELNSDGSLAKEIRLEYWGEKPDLATMNPVVRPSPEESFALKITPIAAR
jgi:hypothetical protein